MHRTRLLAVTNCLRCSDPLPSRVPLRRAGRPTPNPGARSEGAFFLRAYEHCVPPPPIDLSNSHDDRVRLVLVAGGEVQPLHTKRDVRGSWHGSALWRLWFSARRALRRWISVRRRVNLR